MFIGFRTLPLLLALGCLFAGRIQSQESGGSPLGPYGKTSTFCGAGAIPRDQPGIPRIGCFYLSHGHQAAGTIATHLIELSVDDAGVESFKVDGRLVTDTRDTATWTNLPYVSAAGVEGYLICEGPTDRNRGCPASVTVFSRDPDHSVLFVVSNCFPPEYRVCVSTQANLDYERSRRRQPGPS